MRIGDKLPVFAAVLFILGWFGYLRYNNPNQKLVQAGQASLVTVGRSSVVEEIAAELEKLDVQRNRLAAAVATNPLDEEWRSDLKM